MTNKNKKGYWRICDDCGKELYPDAKIEGAITISLGNCPRCGKKDQGLVPIKDYETGNRGIDWD